MPDRHKYRGRGAQGGVAARRSAAEPDELRIPPGSSDTPKEWPTTGQERHVVNLDQLETFLVLARCGSFTRAAAELHLSQPAVSRHVQKLEQELGVSLLTRRRGRIELSEAGERVRSYAEDVVGGYHRLVTHLGNHPSRLAGDLRIVASTTPGEFLVPGL